MIVATLREDQKQAEGKVGSEQKRLESSGILPSTLSTYAAAMRLWIAMSRDFWERKMSEWRTEEQQVKMAIDGLAIAEAGDRALANRAYLLYVSQDSTEKAKLLRMLCSNFSADTVSIEPTYRYPFDLIYKSAKVEKWSGRLDSN